MPDAYEMQEARFVQYRTASSAADATSVLIGPVPEGKIWTILGAVMEPSVAETQVVWWSILSAGATIIIPYTIPQSFAGDPAISQLFPLVREGMELKMLPGDYLGAYRGGHTAGSTLSIKARIIESDMPLYTYTEPQLKKRQAVALSTIRSQIGVVGGVVRSAGEIGGGAAGGGRRSLPK